jgi:hypothetical protein
MLQVSYKNLLFYNMDNSCFSEDITCKLIKIYLIALNQAEMYGITLKVNESILDLFNCNLLPWNMTITPECLQHFKPLKSTTASCN